MKKPLAFFLAAVMLLGLFGCGQPSATTSEADKTTAPNVNQTDPEILSDGNNTFTLDLYQNLKASDGNLFYSPYSISSALAMTYFGARSETEKQMADTLHFTLPQDRLHPAFNSIAQALASRGHEAKEQDYKGFILKNVNALWGQEGYQFLTTFLDGLKLNYDAGMKTLDFVEDTEASRLTINDWVSRQTEDKINDLIPPGGVNGSTRLVLTNAIYFKANWFFQFDDKLTGDGEFNLIDGKKITVPMMKQTESFAYTKGSDYQAVELAYRGKQLAMVILLPDKGRFKTFEDSLEYSKLQQIIDSLEGQNEENRKVNLTMPKFKFTSEYSLKQTLSAMGMANAFSGSADFSGMTDQESLCIDDVIHKAFIAVNEEGTEAAAATAVIMMGMAPGQPEIVDFTMDRPFIFLIRDIQTGTILFVGRVMNPLE